MEMGKIEKKRRNKKANDLFKKNKQNSQPFTNKTLATQWALQYNRDILNLEIKNGDKKQKKANRGA